MNPLLRKIKSAVKERQTEAAQRTAVAKLLAEAGYVTLPQISTARDSHGGTVRFYVFEGSPAGDFALITGPSIEPMVHTLDELDQMDAPGTFSVFAVPASSDVAKRAEQDFRKAAKAEGAPVEKAVRAARKPTAKPREPEFITPPRMSAPARASGRSMPERIEAFEPVGTRMQYGMNVPAPQTIAGARMRRDLPETVEFERPPVPAPAAPAASNDEAMMGMLTQLLASVRGDVIAALRAGG